MHQELAKRGLISPEDVALVMEASCASEAVALISRFYRVFHSAQPGEDRIELLLKAPVPPACFPTSTTNSMICSTTARFRRAKPVTTTAS